MPEARDTQPGSAGAPLGAPWCSRDQGWWAAKAQVTWLQALATAAATVLMTGCSGGADGGDAGSSCPSPPPAPAAELALLPEGLSFERIGPVTHVVSTEGHVTVRAVTSLSLDEATVQLQDAVTAAGYRPAGMDNEGFEAEVFFTSGRYAAGQALVRKGACEGQWDVDLVLIDPDAVPPTAASPSTTGSDRATPAVSPSPTAS